MKRAIVLVAVIVALILTYSVAYGYSEDLFNIIKSMPFELGMSVRRVSNKFEKYVLSSVVESKGLGGEKTVLTYNNGEKETLTFYFQDDVLYGFDYRNWEVK